MKFLIDMPLSPELATWLKEQGYNAVHASDIGLYTASDETILEHARTEQQVIITADLDYPRILALTQANGPGVILFRGGNYSEQEAKELLEHSLNTIPHEEFSISLIVIEKTRIRRRKLPI
jgi:predicted nuclease of predicted toxin-antitoxin system